ncbi:MAG: hypothetical protein JWQ43_2639 [Glaciihabitans sp.]|nr:hypothetical protein [Glaciihabitans sp.]
MTAPWTGGFVRDSLGITIHTDVERSLVPVEQLVGIALRRNPKRAHLLVSTVLAKHVPTPPGLVIAAAELLGLLAGDELRSTPNVLDGTPDVLRSIPDESESIPLAANELGELLGIALKPASAAHESVAALAQLRERIAALRSNHPDVVTIGYAETATGLGQLVADTIGSYYLHSTRHAPVGARPFAGFEEEHSHATDHQLLPTDPNWLKHGGTVVLVDDEISTGTTIINTITAIQRINPQSRWVVAALIDLRSAADRARFDTLAAEVGTTISVVSLGTGSIDLPAGVLDAAAALVQSLSTDEAGSGYCSGSSSGSDCESDSDSDSESDAEIHSTVAERGDIVLVDASTATPAVRSARFGSRGISYRTQAKAIADVVHAAITAGKAISADTAIPNAIPSPNADPAGQRILVLGSEEFIALPVAVADALTCFGGDVFFSTTTRSPIAALDRDDYAIASSIRFRSHDVTSDGYGPRFAYNLSRAGRRFEAIVFFPEPGTDPELLRGDGSVTDALSLVTDRVLVVSLDAADTRAAELVSAEQPAAGRVTGDPFPTGLIPPTPTDRTHRP